MEKKLYERKWARDNSPSPASYRADHDKTSKYNSGTYYKQSKMPKRSFIEREVTVKKNVPGVGKYNPDKSMDFAYRPMRKSRI